jgi:2-C-methyl-D-erythritol 4-phosphate cytidylyltransferase
VTDHTKIPPGGTWCIVVAAGSGRRFGGAKQLEMVDGEMVVARSVRIAASVCDGVVLVLTPEIMDDVHVDGAAVTTSGGATRSASVRQGLAQVPDDARIVLVHDAARPLASPELFARVIDAVRDGAAAAVPAVAMVDTIRSVDGDVIDRDRLRAVQTPQGFDLDVLRAAHADGPEGTDDAGLVEAAGHRVVLVEGEATNLKITSPHDLAVADLLARLAGDGSDPADSGT